MAIRSTSMYSLGYQQGWMDAFRRVPRFFEPREVPALYAKGYQRAVADFHRDHPDHEKKAEP